MNSITELTVKLGGIILRKAEFENNFEKIYSRVFEKIDEIETEEDIEFNFLEIFGNVSG